MKARADDEGILVDTREAASYDVLFDGVAIWSFNAKPRGARGEPHLARWPEAMRPWLDGTARLTLRPAGEEVEEDSEDRARAQRVEPDEILELGTVSFGSGDGVISFVDKRGMPVVIDKWGIVQRPFSTRGEDVTQEMAARTREVIEALHDDLGLDAWMAFGTLLGAAREGNAIGHDSDVDLLYLSEHSSPAQVNLECYRIKRVLTGRGMKAVIKGGSFVTVLFEASDGAPVGIDVYACFYLGGLLHETATVRAPVPREAILPLTTMSFEGHELPAPADPAVLLEASYGPRWQVPDPSFRHQPGPPIINRFDGWFGSMMTNRRAWEMWWHHHQTHEGPSELAQRLLADLPAHANVVDVGAGNGSDALAIARAEHRVLGLEYARHSFRTAVRASKDEQLDLVFGIMNFFDVRDVLTQAAVDRRRPKPLRWLMARGVLDALHPRGVDPFYRYVRTVLRERGRAYLELEEAEDTPRGRYGAFHGGPPRYAVVVADVRRRLEADGADVLLAEQVGSCEADDDGPARTRWHLVAEWSS